MNKKLRIILSILFAVLMFFVSTSFAFVSKEVSVGNIITFGNIKMKLIQTTYEDGIEKEILNGDDLNITSNANLNRNIKIENIGKHPMFVRVSLNMQAETDNECIELLRYVSIKQKDNEWIYKDGWYYYKNEVSHKEITNDLQINIKFDINEITKKYSGAKFNLDIKAEAIQAENNSDDVLEVVGWPS